MPPRPRALLFIFTIAAITWLLVFSNSAPRPPARPDTQKEPVPSSSDSAAAAESFENGLPSKSRHRPATPGISKARTLAILETTIPGTVEFPEQTLSQRVSAINRLLERAGIPSDQLSVAVEARTAEAPFASHGVFESLGLQDPTPATILKYTAGRTRLCYRLSAGLVEFADATFPDPLQDLPDGDDPFAE
jgi:hypothetical protein